LDRDAEAGVEGLVAVERAVDPIGSAPEPAAARRHHLCDEPERGGSRRRRRCRRRLELVLGCGARRVQLGRGIRTLATRSPARVKTVARLTPSAVVISFQ
jgi:hypothetical protein